MLLSAANLLADVAPMGGGPLRGAHHLEIVGGVLFFLLVGFLMVFVVLMVGRLIRPTLDHPEKLTVYECGEPPIGESWVQFDLRFYVVALVFIVFDVEIALFWPWAVVFGAADPATATGALIKQVALFDMLFFFGVVVVGFLFLWRFGYLDWVRASSGQRRATRIQPPVESSVPS